MKRWTLFLVLSLAALVYLAALGWFGSHFSSYARVKDELSLQPRPLESLTLGAAATLELTGRGFDQSTRVQLQLDINNPQPIVGSFPQEGNASDILIEDNLLFLATVKNGLQIYDISKPASPELIRTYQSRDSVLDIEKSGPYYILSCAAQGVMVYEKSTPETLKLVRRFYTNGAAIESRVVGDFLYIAAGSRGVLIYDLRNLEDDQPLAVVTADGYVLGLETYQDRLYFATTTAGVQVYQIQPSGKLFFVGNIADNRVRDVVRYQDKLFLFENSKVSLYQLGAALLPKVLDAEFFTGRIQTMHLSADYLYLSDSHGGVSQTALTQFQQAEASGFIDVGGTPRAMAHKAHYLYIATGRAGLKIVDERAVLPRQAAVVAATLKNVSGMLVSDGWVYVAEREGGLRSNPVGQRDKQTVLLSQDASMSIVVDENLLYVAKQKKGVEIFAIDDPTAPKSIVSWPGLGAVGALVRVDNALVLAKGAEGLTLVDITDFAAPVITDTRADIHALKLAVQDDYIFVAGEKSGVLILRLSAQGRFEQVGKIVPPFPLDSFSAAHDVQVRAGIAYIANGPGGLMIADVRDPRNVKILSSIALPGIASSLTLDGSRVYVSCRNSGLQIVEVSDLKKPLLETSIAMYGLSSGIQIVDGMIYLGSGYSGVTAIPLPQQIKDVQVLSAEQLRVTLPSPKLPGRYNLLVSNKTQTAVLNGVVRYTSAL